ncbi:hypothetical protein JCM3774_005013 [Rhodotorula dairenensis]
MTASQSISGARASSGHCDRSVPSRSASFSSSSSPSGSLHATPGALTISTGFDASGHRVLTSRRRQSVPPSPTKCRKIKTAFGVGDEEDSFSVVPPLAAGLPEPRLAPPTLLLARTRAAVPPSTLTIPDTAAATATTRSPSSLFDPNYTMKSRVTTLERSRSSCHREHLPIKTFTPPPPLVTTSSSSARLTTTLSVLTRSSTLSSSSATTTSASSSSLPGPLTRSNSRLQAFTRRRRSTLKRFSLPNTPSLPPLSPTVTAEGAALERRFSEQPPHEVVVVMGANKLERNTSLGSSYGTCGGSWSSPSVPATPADDGSPVLSSPTSFWSSSAIDVEEPLTTPQDGEKLDPGSAAGSRMNRTENRVVSFDLPTPTATSSVPGPGPRRFGPASAGLDHSPARSSPDRSRNRHARSFSEGMISDSTATRWTATAYGPAFWLAEEELHLTVTNPDLSRTSSRTGGGGGGGGGLSTRPGSAASSSHHLQQLRRSSPPSAPPPASPEPPPVEPAAAPHRPDQTSKLNSNREHPQLESEPEPELELVSVVRPTPVVTPGRAPRATPSSSSTHHPERQQLWVVPPPPPPPPPPPLPHEIGIAC